VSKRVKNQERRVECQTIPKVKSRGSSVESQTISEVKSQELRVEGQKEGGLRVEVESQTIPKVKSRESRVESQTIPSQESRVEGREPEGRWCARRGSRAKHLGGQSSARCCSAESASETPPTCPFL
jgi:hypothetical protein